MEAPRHWFCSPAEVAGTDALATFEPIVGIRPQHPNTAAFHLGTLLACRKYRRIIGELRLRHAPSVLHPNSSRTCASWSSIATRRAVSRARERRFWWVWCAAVAVATECRCATGVA